MTCRFHGKMVLKLLEEVSKWLAGNTDQKKFSASNLTSGTKTKVKSSARDVVAIAPSNKARHTWYQARKAGLGELQGSAEVGNYAG